MPLFSVVIPTYNRATKICRTIDSILNQEFQDFEIIIVDDGSTDNTIQVIADAYAGNSKVHYFRKKNEERSAARNFGFLHAKGEFVVFFDSDDSMLPYHLRILAEKIQEFPECNFFATKFEFNKNGKISPSHLQHTPEGFYDYTFLLKGSFLGTLVCVRRNNPNIHLFPVQFNICEDWIFCMNNLRKDKLYLINKTTISVDDHDERSMAQNQRVIKGRLMAMEYLFETVGFTNEEKNIIKIHSFLFCAVHAYLDNQRQQALFFWKKAIEIKGLGISDLVFFIKIMVGKHFIDKIK